MTILMRYLCRHQRQCVAGHSHHRHAESSAVSLSHSFSDAIRLHGADSAETSQPAGKLRSISWLPIQPPIVDVRIRREDFVVIWTAAPFCVEGVQIGRFLSLHLSRAGSTRSVSSESRGDLLFASYRASSVRASVIILRTSAESSSSRAVQTSTSL